MNLKLERQLKNNKLFPPRVLWFLVFYKCVANVFERAVLVLNAHRDV